MLKMCPQHGMYDGECTECQRLYDDTLKEKPRRSVSNDTKLKIAWRNSVRAQADNIGVCPSCRREKLVPHLWHVHKDGTYECQACFKCGFDWSTVPDDNCCTMCRRELHEPKEWHNSLVCRKCASGYCWKHNAERGCEECKTEKKVAAIASLSPEDKIKLVLKEAAAYKGSAARNERDVRHAGPRNRIPRVDEGYDDDGSV